MLMLSAFTVPIIIIGIELSTSTNNDGNETNTLIVALCVLLVIACAFLWLFWTSKLVTEIVEDGIRFRFFPIIRKWKKIHKSEIAACKVRQYKPIVEYGGWGIKVGKRGSGRAYNVSGNIGLQMHLKNGKKILLGTQKKQALQYAINKVFLNDDLSLMNESITKAEPKKLFGGRTKKLLLIVFVEIVLAIVIISLIQIFK